ncbi:MAG: hypothetical protein HY083_07585 [Gammaproteobacteria bacterium]|nr:hypothetical protein [Gammaproteobacteria bacterium]
MSHGLHGHRAQNRQHGAALITALVLLVALTVLTLASLGTSLLQLRMSGNEESTMKARQATQAVIDNVIDNASTNFTVTGDIGYTTTGVALTGTTFDSASSAKITRITKETSVTGYDTSLYRGASFAVEAKYDKSSLGQGKAVTTQGYMRVYPCVAQCGGGAPASSAHN